MADVPWHESSACASAYACGRAVKASLFSKPSIPPLALPGAAGVRAQLVDEANNACQLVTPLWAAHGQLQVEEEKEKIKSQGATS